MNGSARRRFLQWFSALGAAAVSSGCQRVFPGSAVQRLDLEWHRRDLIEGLLQPWLHHARRSSGAFCVAFDGRWQPRQAEVVYLLPQSRLVFTMAVGYDVSRDPSYLDAARQGADFLLRYFRDEAHGGFFFACGLDGKPARQNKRAYDHTFALLALAEMHRVTGEETYRTAALNAWRDIDRGFVDASGGVVNEATRTFVPTSQSRTQNPVMHLFEALLALAETTGALEAADGVRRIGEFVAYRLLQGVPGDPGQGALIPEWYDTAWKPLPNKAAGGYVDLGHQFEWSHLFSQAEPLVPMLGLVGNRVFSYALMRGYDEVEGGCFNRDYPGEAVPLDRSKGWWQQAECLRALMVVASRTGRQDLWRRYEQTMAFIRRELINPDGGWHAAYALPCRTGGCRDEQPDPYHMASLHRHALRMGGGMPDRKV